MIEMHSKYDNMHTNGMFYALICINNHVLSCYDCMLSIIKCYLRFMMNVMVFRDRDGAYVALDGSEVLRSSLIIGALCYCRRKIYRKDVLQVYGWRIDLTSYLEIFAVINRWHGDLLNHDSIRWWISMSQGALRYHYCGADMLYWWSDCFGTFLLSCCLLAILRGNLKRSREWLVTKWW